MSTVDEAVALSLGLDARALEPCIRVYLYDVAGKFRSITWCPTGRGARAVLDEAERNVVHARVIYADGTERELNRDDNGEAWIAGPRSPRAARPNE